MANEMNKDFNAMLHNSKDMPKIQIVSDPRTIIKYGGTRMFLAPPIDYSNIMAIISEGKVITVGEIRRYFAKRNNADFTDPITAGIFVSLAACASEQRDSGKIPYWRTLKAGGELNHKYPGGLEAQRKQLKGEGHTIVRRGRTNIKYYVKDFESVLYRLS